MSVPHCVSIGEHVVGPGQPLLVIAGPCVLESRGHALTLAGKIAKICGRVGVPLAFKASFDKANRSSVQSYRGPGLAEGLGILAEVRGQLSMPVVSDVHEPAQVAPAAEVLDCLQVPAFLCRQTDLLLAVGRAGKPVNIKKGQFMSPGEMRGAVEKVRSTGNDSVLLCERGTFFGYHRLVNDMTGLATMRRWAPVVFDATHSVQQPGGQGDRSGGSRELSPVLARAACGAGIDALFLEVHDNPEAAKSDAATVMPVDWLEEVLVGCKRIHEAVGAAADHATGIPLA